MLSEAPKPVLAEILKTNGTVVLTDFSKLKTILTRQCPQLTTENNLILSVLGLQIPQAILSSLKEPADKVHQELFHKLTEEAMLKPEAATWALETWALALGRTDWPESELKSESTADLEVSDGEAGASKEEGAPPSPPSSSDLEKAEGLIRQANLAKIRGDRVGFEKLIEEASATAPGSSLVQETIGDAYIDRKQVRKAKDAYQLAVKIDPKNASAERKFGEAVLAIQFALNPTFGESDDSFVSGKAATILCVFIPGLGQLVGGDSKKGTIMLAGWAASLITALVIPNGLTGLPRLFGMHRAFDKPVPPANNIVLLPLALAVFFWMWSVSNAGSRSKTYHKPIINRPVPPVDKDYEL